MRKTKKTILEEMGLSIKEENKVYITECTKADCRERAKKNILIVNKDTGERTTFCLCSYHASKINEAIKEIIND